MEDLIQNAYTLFDERFSSPVPSPNMAESTSTLTYGSLFMSPELRRPTEVQAVGSTTQQGPGVIGGISTRPSLSTPPLHSPVERQHTPTRISLLSPLLGLSSPQIPTEGVETATHEQVVLEARGTQAVETLPNSPPQENLSSRPTSVAEWRLRVPQPQLHPDPDAPPIPQSPPESVRSGTTDFSLASAGSNMLSNSSDFTLSPAPSLQSWMGPAAGEIF